jgi:hypothetical protein
MKHALQHMPLSSWRENAKLKIYFIYNRFALVISEIERGVIKEGFREVT